MLFRSSLTNYVFLGRCDSSPYGCPAGTVSGGTLTSNPLNGSLLWVAPALPAGGEATADLTLQINNAILQLDSFRVGASLSSGAQSLNEDPVAGNNSAGVTFRRVNTGGTPNVIITQVTCPTDFPGPDQRMVWYVEFENTGTAPSQSRYIYLYNGVFYDGTKPNLLYGRAVVPSLLPGQKLSTAFFVQPSVYFPTPGDAGTGEKSIFTGKLYLSYSEDGATEDYGINDGFPDLSCKTYTTDLSLDILANASPIGPRDPLQFKMIIYNNGPEDAYNIWTPIYIDSYTPSFPAKQVNAAVTNGSVWNYAPNFGANGTIFTYWYIPVLRRGQTAGRPEQAKQYQANHHPRFDRNQPG